MVFRLKFSKLLPRIYIIGGEKKKRRKEKKKRKNGFVGNRFAGRVNVLRRLGTGTA